MKKCVSSPNIPKVIELKKNPQVPEDSRQPKDQSSMSGAFVSKV